MKTKHKTFRILGSDRGETIIEIVTSLALFAVTILTVATLFMTANRILIKNIQSERTIQEQLAALSKVSKLPLEPESGVQVLKTGGVESQTIVFEYNDKVDGTGTIQSVSYPVVLAIPHEQSGLAKFIEQVEN